MTLHRTLLTLTMFTLVFTSFTFANERFRPTALNQLTGTSAPKAATYSSTGAEIAYIDYEAIRRDFSELMRWTDQQIRRWVLAGGLTGRYYRTQHGNFAEVQANGHKIGLISFAGNGKTPFMPLQEAVERVTNQKAIQMAFDRANLKKGPGKAKFHMQTVEAYAIITIPTEGKNREAVVLQQAHWGKFALEHPSLNRKSFKDQFNAEVEIRTKAKLEVIIKDRAKELGRPLTKDEKTEIIEKNRAIVEHEARMDTFIKLKENPGIEFPLRKAMKDNKQTIRRTATGSLLEFGTVVITLKELKGNFTWSSQEATKVARSILAPEFPYLTVREHLNRMLAPLQATFEAPENIRTYAPRTELGTILQGIYSEFLSGRASMFEVLAGSSVNSVKEAALSMLSSSSINSRTKALLVYIRDKDKNGLAHRSIEARDLAAELLKGLVEGVVDSCK